MLRASGALELLCTAFAPAAEQLGLPGELLPMALLRPVSGSGALALFEDILTQFGPDSFIGRTASVLMGSTETTFYTIALYFGATKVRNTRHCLPAACCRPGGDLSERRRCGIVPGAWRPICKTAGFVIK